ncbi:MAG: alpha/beta hydrolase [candidate division KSB1 bacterium]|nr:alpha/beta hydrolase [candidate division KSB1 bacterium]
MPIHRILHSTLLALSRRLNRRYATLESRRQRLERFARLIPMPRGVRRTAAMDSFPAEWLVPAGAPEDAAILYLHGGGYVMGSIRTHRALAARIARAAGVKCLTIGYRLAPEHPFPAALEDAHRAYGWLLQQKIPPQRLVVAGDSAGGGLALALLLFLRDRGEPLPAAAVCLSPWTDLAGTGDSIRSKAAVDPIVPVAALDYVARQYLHGENPKNPYASPLYGDLHGLPPLFIHVGTHEVLLDDSLRLAEKARAAGVRVTLDIWPDMMHVWHFFAPFLPEARQAIGNIGAFIRKAIQPVIPQTHQPT